MVRSRRYLGDAVPPSPGEDPDDAEKQALVDQIKGDLAETVALHADLDAITDEAANGPEAQEAARVAAEDVIAAARSLEAARRQIDADLARLRAEVEAAEAAAMRPR